MEIGSCVKCAETFSACGCGSKAAERYEAYEDPITDRQESVSYTHLTLPTILLV